mgnify:CR=1 FL=1
MEQDIRYLTLLSREFPSVQSACAEIIKLEAIRSLPKGTEHFMSDIHGEHEAFLHILNNASGAICEKIEELFESTLTSEERRGLAVLIYYPVETLHGIHERASFGLNDWYRVTLHRLIEMARYTASKYSRSKVRKALPQDFAYIMEELLNPQDQHNKHTYYDNIIRSVIDTGMADTLITELCTFIKRMAVDTLHIVGDIFDRGPHADVILDNLMGHHSVDIQWGNHDVLWMGACAGNDVCICNVVRIALRYDNMLTLEDGYGINLVNLATFAMDVYGDDPCQEFLPKVSKDVAIDDKSRLLIARMHKAISVIQFKLEAALVDKHPLWKMGSRKLLEAIDFKAGTCRVDGKAYKMLSCHFPTIDPAHPNKLTPEEEVLISKLHHSFVVSEKLRSHINLILRRGCMFKKVNGNLLYHASIPLNADGSFKAVEILPGKSYKGRELLYHLGMMIRSAFQQDCDPKLRQEAIDYFCYLWCGPDSPLFDKAKMATFERYFLAEKETHKENKGFYYALRDDEATADRILDEFEVEGKNRHIINGHVPVHVSKGENPIKAGGKLMVIDGGFAQAYHKETGIAGYTLVYHSRGFQLVQHEPFTSTDDAIKRGTDIRSTTQIVEMNYRSLRVADTDKGKELRRQIEDLQELLHAYRHGFLTEGNKRNPPKL